MKAVVSYQRGLCSHPTAEARVDAVCGSSLLLVLFIALGNFSTGTYNKFHNPTTSRKAAISNVYCHFNLKHTINTCEKILRAPAAKLVLITKANLYLVVNLYLSSLVLKYYQLIFIVLNGQTVKQSVGHSPKLTS